MTQNDTELLFAKLNQETAVICFDQLQRFFAQGKVIIVDKDKDLVGAATQVAADNTQSVDTLIQTKTLNLLDDDQAKSLIKNNSDVWAVVVAPWVLIQIMK